MEIHGFGCLLVIKVHSYSVVAETVRAAIFWQWCDLRMNHRKSI